MVQVNNYHHGNLRDSLIQNGIKILLEEGIEKLTLRSVAKRSGVSHNAPYRAFKNKDDLIIGIARQIYSELLDLILEVINHPSGDPDKDFRSLCTSFYHYAIRNPIKYRLIAGNSISDQGNYHNLTSVVQEAYTTVKAFLELHIESGYFNNIDSSKMAILCISTIHGYCTIVIDNKFDLLNNELNDHQVQLDFIIDQLLLALQKNPPQ